ncbi:hypothetical protein GIB67_015347 [Kingdonia uniflora]|uniref:Uncharacterized protein n=1 Tax=Kingdonia uniflora TaxID=39325 RepID=A0A7J7KYY1_9MAGN|nr:hypothetical protein GIB67_015347 [Kingdonia uniflora]
MIFLLHLFEEAVLGFDINELVQAAKSRWLRQKSTLFYKITRVTSSLIQFLKNHLVALCSFTIRGSCDTFVKMVMISEKRRREILLGRTRKTLGMS